MRTHPPLRRQGGPGWGLQGTVSWCQGQGCFCPHEDRRLGATGNTPRHMHGPVRFRENKGWCGCWVKCRREELPSLAEGTSPVTGGSGPQGSTGIWSSGAGEWV